MKKKSHLFFVFAALILILQACNLPGSSQPTETLVLPTAAPPTSEPPPAETPGVQHQSIPVSAPDAAPYPDVESSGTAPEKRAPYGDSYSLNRLERPFTQDMIYIPDMDIASFGISEDSDWYFVSIGLIGKNPNNLPGIHFAVELDTNLDSFGDYLILAEPPYLEEWTAENVRVYADTNRDTAGNSASRSDAPFSGNGYDSLIHSLAENVSDDPDLAWVRINAGPNATVQFAFKKSWAGGTFMYGVMTDGGLKDVARLDYVDYFTEQEGGSPIRSNIYYPLKALYAVDNTCFQAFGFKPTGYEPKICPEIVQPSVGQPGEPPPPGAPPETGCEPPAGGCPLNGPWDPDLCLCGPG
jgi:hypothetical protein